MVPPTFNLPGGDEKRSVAAALLDGRWFGRCVRLGVGVSFGCHQKSNAGRQFEAAIVGVCCDGAGGTGGSSTVDAWVVAGRASRISSKRCVAVGC